MISMYDQFYFRGRNIIDAGFIAAMMWRNDWLVSGPTAVQTISFYNTHFTPLFGLLSSLSYLVPVNMVTWFALFMAVSYSAITAGAYYLLVKVYRLRSFIGAAFAAAFGVFLAFNGVARATIAYPHYEHAIPILMFLFLIFAVQRRFLVASIFFVLCLMVREDAGFHMTAVLGLLAVVNFVRRLGWREQKHWLIFGAAALAYSVLSLIIVKAYFPGDPALHRVYLGDPPFAHLTAELIKERLGIFFEQRVYVWLPALVVLAWSIAWRDPYPALGFLAYLPWLTLHLTAVNDTAGRLWAYYAFPFMMAVMWPMIAPVVASGPEMTVERRRRVLPWLTLLLAASMVTFGHTTVELRQGWSDIAVQSWIRTARAVEAFKKDRGRLSRLGVDPDFASLAPNSLTPHNWMDKWLDDQRIQTAIYFRNGFYNRPLVKRIIAQALYRGYLVDKTNLALASNWRMETLPHLGPMLKPANIFLNLCWPRILIEQGVGYAFTRPGLTQEMVAWLDRLELPVGRIAFLLAMGVKNVADETKPVITLELASEGRVVVRRDFFAADLSRRGRFDWVEMEYEVDKAGSKRQYIFKIIHYANAELTFEDLRIFKR